MSVLTDKSIRARMGLRGNSPKRLVIDPFSDYGECPPECISYGLSSGGYDLRVGTRFFIFTNTTACVVDPKSFDLGTFAEVNTAAHSPVCIPPNCFALAATVEYIEMPCDLVAEVRGKSRLARVGYIMASTPIEPGWRGHITLEIGNLSPLPMKVYAGEGIGQLVFMQLDGFPEYTYETKPNKRFQDQKGITGPGGT